MNLMSAPGAGKTTLLEATIRAIKGSYRVAVIEGDLQTDLDALRIRALGVRSHQITTGTVCHLDARMIRRHNGEPIACLNRSASRQFSTECADHSRKVTWIPRRLQFTWPRNIFYASFQPLTGLHRDSPLDTARRSSRKGEFENSLTTSHGQDERRLLRHGCERAV